MAPDMRWVFRVLPVVLMVALVTLVLMANSLPERRTLQRSVVIEAPVADVYRRVGYIRGWEGWYVPPQVGRFEGPEHGAGGTLIVDDEESNEVRRLVLTETSSPGFVWYEMPDKDQNPYDIRGGFALKATKDGQTLVTSSQELISRTSDDWMARTGERWFLYGFADTLVGTVLERELHNLKGAVEGLPPPGSSTSTAAQ